MRPILQARFYETYYFANVARNILYDQFPYLRNLNDFYGDGLYLNYIKPFPKYSAFHCFIEFLIDNLLAEANEDVDLEKRKQQLEQFKNIPSALKEIQPTVLPIEHAFQFHGIDHTSFADWLREQEKTFNDTDLDDVYEYLSDLRFTEPWDVLIYQSVREVFHLLFANRHLLMIFNKMMADQVSDTIHTELDADVAKYFRKDGVLRRHNIPSWVQRAVFFRDRGLCVACQRDLTGLINAWSQENFDHMVPLNSGGLNDVTNIQLLCSECNLKKRASSAATSQSYEDWYPIERSDSTKQSPA